MTTTELLANALHIHNGEADLTDLYVTYGTLRVVSSGPLPPEWRSGVRYTLQTSPRFVRVERGRWRLRRGRTPR